VNNLVRTAALAACMLFAAAVVFAYDFKVKPSCSWDAPQVVEVWENRTIHITCFWSMQVTLGPWKTAGNPEVKAAVWIDSPVLTPDLLKEAPGHGIGFENRTETDGHVAAGTWSPGTAWGGTLTKTFVPLAAGENIVYCGVTSSDPGWRAVLHNHYLYEEWAQTPGHGNFPLSTTTWPGSFPYFWCGGSMQNDVWGPTGYVQVSAPEPFTKDELPVPEITQPVEAPGGVVLTIQQGTLWTLGGRIPAMIVTGKTGPGKNNDFNDNLVFWDWAKKGTKVFEERWNLELLKRDAAGMYAPVQTYSGLVNAQDFTTHLSPHFFEQHGAGVYRLDTWLTQEKTPQGTVKGKVASVEFEIQLKPKTVEQVSKPGAVVPPPPKVGGVNAPAAAVTPHVASSGKASSGASAQSRSAAPAAGAIRPPATPMEPATVLKKQGPGGHPRALTPTAHAQPVPSATPHSASPGPTTTPSPRIYVPIGGVKAPVKAVTPVPPAQARKIPTPTATPTHVAPRRRL
jgi:hypothetical protein